MSEYVNRLIEKRLERLSDDLRHTESQIESCREEDKRLVQYREELFNERDELRRELK
ncbi:hypothetical protein [Sporosarcina sp. P34]|uniref:hypothetical protein n=1 Tax=Sporosarcina sp. P34 TaxID=2048247 RepID=UPI0013043006|nr:hypothetical protein [Sporosarcina sp. P34]